MHVVEAQSQSRRRVTRRLWLPEHQLGLTAWLGEQGQTLITASLGALTLATLILLLADWGFDDPYITFRYARNLLEGHGLVYNVGQRTLSTTTPLYAILLAGLGLLWPDLPLVSNVVSAGALVGAAASLVAWSRGRGEAAVGHIAALLLCLWPLVLMSFGMETCLYLALILVGFVAYDREKLDLAAGALALGTLIRPEGVLAMVVLAFFHLARRRPLPARPALLYAVLVGAWYAGLWLYYGAPLPVTLMAKHQQGGMDISTRFAPGFADLLVGYARRPLYWLHGVLALVGVVQVWSRGRHWLPLLAWTALYFLAYTLLGVSRYFWYYAPLVPALVVLIAEGAVAVIRRVARLAPSRALAGGLAALMVVALLAPLGMEVLALAWNPDPRLAVYPEIGDWLAAHTPARATVGALEVGIIGYHSRRRMVGFAGLLQPEVARQLGPTQTYQDSAAWVIQRQWPDYLVLDRVAFAGLTGSDWFQRTYEAVRDFTDTRSSWLTVYRRGHGP